MHLFDNLVNRILPGIQQPQQQAMPVQRRTIYTHMSTTNKSFLDMHFYLKSRGITNNAFMLALFDPDLEGVDPFDSRLNTYMKQKVLFECMTNFWYFIRECVRIPIEGSTGNGARYQLHRGNMAYNYISALNLNIFLELPRQQFKTSSALIRYLWIFNFGTTNSLISFLNKNHGASKKNLGTFKKYREALPSYLRMDQDFAEGGKKLKTQDTVETLAHKSNGNKINTVPSARSEAAAANLIRGETIPLIWMDEHAFIAHNGVIYINAVPALKTAWRNAKANGSPYGILITTTPGFLATKEGEESYNMKENASVFTEEWYDFSYAEIRELIDANTKSTYVYIRYTYQQLGCTEEWFADLCKEMGFKYEDIRREILLEWSRSSENSPFRRDDLEKLKLLIREPIKQFYINKKWLINVYKQIEYKNGMPVNPPIVGVDAAGGLHKDSSAITILDSGDTSVIADFKCNHVSLHDFAKIIHDLVVYHFQNAVVNVERNGGWGQSVLQILAKSKIKKNLYFEIKDKVYEEKISGAKLIKETRRTKVYGITNDHRIRELLMEILKDRVEYHKDKIVSKSIFEELMTLEVKRSGRIEHANNAHDDQVFSWLIALYVWYEGINLNESFGIQKKALKTEEDIDEILPDLDEEMSSIVEELTIETNEEQIRMKKDLANLQKAMGKTYWDWIKEQEAGDAQSEADLMATPLGRKAYATTYNDEDCLQAPQIVKLPDSVFTSFYDGSNN